MSGVLQIILAMLVFWCSQLQLGYSNNLTFSKCLGLWVGWEE
jgi:hypothetical protein